MIKRVLSVFLIAMLLALPGAQAEQTAYFPFRTTLALFGDAFERGDLILMDMNFQLSTNENSAGIFGEDTELVNAIAKALPQATLSLGLGRLEDGVRLILAGDYTENDQAASLALLSDLTQDGVSIMLSSLPGERLTAKWETLLTLCGASPEEAAQIMSLRGADLNALMAELATQLAPMLELAAQIAAPYGETIVNHFSALPMEVHTDVPAENGFPAAATEVCFLITQKAIGDLMTALADQLEADTTLCALLNTALAESGESVTASQLCQAVKASAAESWTDESTPLYVYVGMDEADNFLYTSISSLVEDAPMFSLVSSPYEDTGLSLLSIDFLTLTDEGNPGDGISLAIVYLPAPSGDTLADLQVYLQIYEDEAVILAAEAAGGEISTTTEDGLPGRTGQYTFELVGGDETESIHAAITGESMQNASADGGEESAFLTFMDVTAGDVSIPLSCEVSMITTPGETGLVSSVNSTVSVPTLGIDEYAENYTFYAIPYELDSSTLAETALETASQADLEALANRAAASVQETLNTLITLLPPELIELMQ